MPQFNLQNHCQVRGELHLDLTKVAQRMSEPRMHSLHILKPQYYSGQITSLPWGTVYV